MIRWVGLVARAVVGGVWLTAGLLKLPDPAESVRAVRAYQLLPDEVVPTVGHALPLIEVAVGALLLAGVLTRGVALASGLLFAAFIFGISWAWAQGLQIDCGCFGGGGLDENASEDYPWEILRDTGLLLLSAFLAWRPRTPLSLDSVIFDEGEE